MKPQEGTDLPKPRSVAPNRFPTETFIMISPICSPPGLESDARDEVCPRLAGSAHPRSIKWSVEKERLEGELSPLMEERRGIKTSASLLRSSVIYNGNYGLSGWG